MSSPRTKRIRSEPRNALGAQYLRVSTEYQEYSTENQAAAIFKYAQHRGLTIIRTYQDDAKSGLRLQGRPALQQLIAEAKRGTCEFGNILVYDVSRWGRFQDVDESAYYEFVCKAAGLAVHYCAEQFANDGTPLAALIKNLKRAMAAEYSRELSAKVFAGQCRLIARGFRQGGMAGYGLRRLLVDEDGKPKQILQSGERKSFATDRVILVPGPRNEVALVRRVYELFVRSRLSACAIARTLNDEGATYTGGSRWNYENVYLVLKNEKYIGNNVFNRKSSKLNQKTVANPPDEWVRAVGCFEPIVDSKMFLRAKRRIGERKQHTGNNKYLLDCLRVLLAKNGRLSVAIIDANKDGPKHATYQRRFGGFRAAYRLIGYEPFPAHPRGRDGKFRTRPFRPRRAPNHR